MTEMEILRSDLHDIYDILQDNGYGAWCRTIRKAVELLDKQQPKTGHWKRTGRKNVYGGIEVVCSVCDNHVMVQNLDDELFCRHCGAEMSETFNPVDDT